MAETNVAVVGLGAFGLRYVEALRALAGVRVGWACDLDDARLEAVASRGVKVTNDLIQICADPMLDAVVVATPEAAHRAVTVAALDAGKHVIVEKPLATTDADALAMIEAAERSGRLLLPAFLLRFDYRYAQVKQRLNEIGTVRNVYAYRNFDRDLFRTYSRTHSFVENAIHDIDLILWYVGDRVERAHGFCRNTLGLENPDVNWGILEFEGGTIAVLQTSWGYPPQEHRNLQWNAGMQLMGDRGVLEVANDAAGFRANLGDAGILLLDQSAWADIHGEPRGAFGAMLRHFVAVIRGTVPFAGTPPREALESMRIARQLTEDARRRGG